VNSKVTDEEESTKISYLLPSTNDLILIYLHLDKDILIGDNQPNLVSEGKTKPDYK